MRFSRYLIAAVAILAVMISLRGWASASVSPTANRTATCSPQPCVTTSDGWAIAVTGMQYGAATSTANDASGSVVVQMDVTFTNHSGRTKRATPDELVLLDPTGPKHPTAMTTTCAGWPASDVGNGARTGPLCTSFLAAAGHPQGLTLIWNPQLLGDREYQVHLS